MQLQTHEKEANSKDLLWTLEIWFDGKIGVETQAEDVKEMWAISAGRLRKAVYEGRGE